MDIDRNLNSIIELNYLMDEAPFESLRLENTFKRYEGRLLVAEREVQRISNTYFFILQPNTKILRGRN